MNRISRLLGTAALATSLTLGGSALTAGAAFAGNGNYDHSSYINDHRDYRDRDGDRDRHRDHRHSDRHNHYKFVYHCYNRWDHDWYSYWSNRYEHKRNCYVYVVRY